MEAPEPGEDGPAHHAAMSGRLDELRTLLAAGFDVDLPGSYGRRILHYATADARSVEMTNLVLDAGADMNVRNEGGDNALFDLITQESASVEVVQALIDHGFDIHATGRDGRTALSWACYCGRTRIVELLLDNGGDLDGTRHPKGKTPVGEAISGKNPELVRLLLDRGADPNAGSTYASPLQFALDRNDPELFEQVIQLCLQRTGSPPLSIHRALVEAAWKGRTDMVKRLVGLGAALDPESGEKPLIQAAYYKHTDLVRFFLDEGADIEARDSSGNTALSHAAWSGHLPTVELLLDRGAELDVVNRLNWNPLMQAVVEGHVEVARHLLGLGARTDLVDQEKGVTVLSIAKASHDKVLVELLEQHGGRERDVKTRDEREAWFSILDCEICQFLPYKKDLGRTEEERFPLLTRVHTHSEQPDRYTTYSVTIYRCGTCGTYYQHDYMYDDEDAWVSGPSVSQHLQRLNLEHLQLALTERGLPEELKALHEHLPGLLEQIADRLRENGTALPEHLWRWFLDCRLDQLLLARDWGTIESELLGHTDPEIAAQTVNDLVMAHSETSYASGPVQRYRTFRHTTEPIRELAISLVKTHQDAIRSCLQRLAGIEGMEARSARVAETVEYYLTRA